MVAHVGFPPLLLLRYSNVMKVPPLLLPAAEKVLDANARCAFLLWTDVARRSAQDRHIINTSLPPPPRTLGAVGTREVDRKSTPARQMFAIISDAITAANEAMHGQPLSHTSPTGAGQLCNSASVLSSAPCLLPVVQLYVPRSPQLFGMKHLPPNIRGAFPSQHLAHLERSAVYLQQSKRGFQKAGTTLYVCRPSGEHGGGSSGFGGRCAAASD